MLKKILKYTFLKKNSHPLHLVFNLNDNELKEDLLSQSNIDIIAENMGHLLYLDIKGEDVFNNAKLLQILKSFETHQGFSCLSLYTTSVDNQILEKQINAILSLQGDFMLKVIFSMDNIGEKLDLQKSMPGEFDAIIANIALLENIKKNNSRVKTEILTIASKDNITNLIDIMDYVKNKVKGVDFHNLSVVKDAFNREVVDASMPHVNSLEARKTLILRTWKYYLQKNKANMFIKKLTMGFLSLFIDKSLQTIKNKKMVINCYAGIVYSLIDMKGDVFFCSFDKPVGNLSDYNYVFPRLWYSEVAREKRINKKCSCFDEAIIKDSILFNKKFYFEIFKRKGMWTEI